MGKLNKKLKKMYDKHLAKLQETVNPTINFIGADGSPRGDRDKPQSK